MVEGVVRSIDNDRIHVLFDLGDDITEQVYKRRQFLDGKSPNERDRLTVFVHMTRRPLELPEKHEDSSEHTENEQSPRRKAAIRGPHKF